MSEKEKAKYDGSRFDMLRSCLIFSFFPLLIVTSFAIISIYWAVGGFVKPSLDPQYIPTAEYLLEHSITHGTSSLNVEYDAKQGSNNLTCFTITSFSLDEFFNLRWAEFYINEQVVSRYRDFYPIDAEDAMIAGSRFCFGHLDSGLHIIEFRAKEGLFTEPYYIQRWAIEIP